MILGYSISGPDNDSYLNEKLYGKNICECLNYIRNRENYITSEFKIKKTKYDFSNTYDSAIIVSKKFKNFCENEKLKGIEFYQLKEQKGFYLFKVNQTVEFDSERRKTEFIEYNKSCGEFNEVVGVTPVCLKKNEKLKTGFFKTDIEFGRGYAKGNEILVDFETFEKMKKEKFKGLYGEKILDKYNWEK